MCANDDKKLQPFDTTEHPLCPLKNITDNLPVDETEDVVKIKGEGNVTNTGVVHGSINTVGSDIENKMLRKAIKWLVSENKQLKKNNTRLQEFIIKNKL